MMPRLQRGLCRASAEALACHTGGYSISQLHIMSLQSPRAAACLLHMSLPHIPAAHHEPLQSLLTALTVTAAS